MKDDRRHYPPLLEWRTLKTRTKGKRMLFVTIPVQLIVKAGFNPDRKLEGNWSVKRGRLILRIREVGESG